MCRSKSVPIIESICFFVLGNRGENMYLALYRKYRPRTFDDVISQEHITTTLKNQVRGGTSGHAYLFTGSRGTGKTTCAKILAMAVNCENPKDGNPCLECERCREILDGSSTDIVEMDAASNNGVDDVRQLRDEVAYTPVSCKYRVYIIDEVHMLSVQAFNALLKTLEEPPPHVKFILATTELHKVLSTISSRCQRFEFRRVDMADSARRLLEVAEKEGVTLDRDAAELISRLSDGGMRDALSILDRCICADKHVTSAVVRDCVGVADNRHLREFSEMTANGDTAGCIRLLGELYKGSKDIAVIVDELSGHFRDLMLCKTAPEDKDLLSALPDEYEEIERIAGLFSLEEILRCLTLLRKCADGIGKVKQRKIAAEMCFVRMCAGSDYEPVQPAPVRRSVPNPPVQSAPRLLEPPVGEPPIPSLPDEPLPKDDMTVESVHEENPVLPPLTEITQQQWQDAIPKITDFITRNMLQGSSAMLESGILTITSPNEMLHENVKGGDLKRLEDYVSEALGSSVHIRLIREKAASVEKAEQTPLEKMFAKAKELGIEVNIKK